MSRRSTEREGSVVRISLARGGGAGVMGVGFRVRGSWCGVQGTGGMECGVQGLGGMGCGVQGTRCMGVGFRGQQRALA